MKISLSWWCVLVIFIILPLFSTSDCPNKDIYIRSSHTANLPFTKAHVPDLLKKYPKFSFMLKDHYSTSGIGDISSFNSEKCSTEQDNQLRTSLTTWSEDDFRLPKSLYPIHYYVQICPELQKPIRFFGLVEIELLVMNITNEITLNMADLKMLSWSLKHSKSLNSTEVQDIFRPIPPTKNMTQRRKNDKFNNLFNTENLHNTSSPSNRDKLGRKSKGKDIPLLHLVVNPNLQRIIIKANEDLKVNNVYKLKLKFMGIGDSSELGLFSSTHVDVNGNERLTLATQFQISGARRVFPCFDEPYFRSTFTIKLCRNETHQTLSNMPKVSTIPSPGHPGMVWDEFAKSFPMSTYIVAFVVLDDFQFLRCGPPSIPFKVWVPTVSLERAEFACKYGPKALGDFEQLFQVPSILHKVDMVLANSLPYQAMENWGLMVYQEEVLLTNDSSPESLKIKHDVLTTICHEITHQWFGNLVTPSWWTGLWLSEGFATFYAVHGALNYFPSWELEQDFILSHQQHEMETNSVTPKSIIGSPTHPQNLDSFHSFGTYIKGFSFLRMVMSVLSEPVFIEGIQSYLKTMRFRNVAEEDMWPFFSQAGHQRGTLPTNLSLTEIMSTWTVQEGYPAVTVISHRERSLVLTQVLPSLNTRRCVLPLIKCQHKIDPTEVTNHEEGVREESKWWIPLSFVTKQEPNMSDTSPKFWMSSHRQEVKLPTPLDRDDWYLLNIRQTGFFRVNYNKENWLLLIKQLGEDHRVFDEITRAQLIDDCFAFAYTGNLNFEVPLDLLAYLDQEKSAHTLRSAFDHLRVMKFPYFTGTSLDEEIKNYFLRLLTVHYPSDGLLSPSSDQPHVRKMTSVLIQLICDIYESCTEEVFDLFNQWMNNTEISIPRDLKETIFSVGMNQAGIGGWELCKQQFYSHSDFMEKREWIIILCKSKHLEQIKKFFYEVVYEDDGLGPIFGFIILETLAKQFSTVGYAWELLLDVWPNISSSYRKLYLDAVAPYLHTDSHYQQFKELIKSPYTQAAVPEERIKDIETEIVNSIAFLNRRIKETTQWVNVMIENRLF